MTRSLGESTSTGMGGAAATDDKFPALSEAFKLHFDVPERLNHNGKQKLVYRAIWRPIQRNVIVKYHRDAKRTELTEMEMVAHPLSLSHPNVVETHVVGSAPEVFLVEREVTALRNDWPLHGMDQAVTLLCHIARALCFLQRKNYIHADIKPENLGLDRDRFILMDFGACKKFNKFHQSTDMAGTLRTRAPEVLAKSSPRSHKSDLWSLAASLFRLFTRRFPLLSAEEEAQLDTDDPVLKEQVIKVIEQRAKGGEEWKSDFWEHDCWKDVPRRLRPLMREMLEHVPDKRIDAQGVVKCCEEEFAACLLEDLPAAPIALASQNPMLPVLRALRDSKAGVGFKESLKHLPLLTRQRQTQWLKDLLLLNDLSETDKEFIRQQLIEVQHT